MSLLLFKLVLKFILENLNKFNIKFILENWNPPPALGVLVNYNLDIKETVACKRYFKSPWPLNGGLGSILIRTGPTLASISELGSTLIRTGPTLASIQWTRVNFNSNRTDPGLNTVDKGQF